MRSNKGTARYNNQKSTRFAEWGNGSHCKFKHLPGVIDVIFWLSNYKKNQGTITMVYLTIIPRARVGYEMMDSQRGA